ncbi:MAG: hypothetical protein EOO23_08395 [Comamonadaceae bacterium]|nr:MAG: hypothetical protein EOO23_08395 [Comamonadaceae bacterium]
MGDRSLRRAPQRQSEALHLDRQRNRHPGQGHASLRPRWQGAQDKYIYEWRTTLVSL